jgi:hypothetical protein
MDLDKLCIEYLRDGKITMDQYVDINNLNIFNVKKVSDYINTFEHHFKDMFYDKYKNILKYKDNTIIFKNKIILNRLTNIKHENFTFTKNQLEIINELIRFLSDPTQKYYGLYGFAGTGKTTSLVMFITFMIQMNYIKSVVFTSPTNKALNVIKNKFINSLYYLLNHYQLEYDDKKTFDENLEKLKKFNILIEFETIHKLLNYKTEYNISGNMIFSKDKDSNIKLYDIIVIDECSMVSLNLIYDIINESKNINTKIIFSGDPAQLPPVNEKTSIIFMNENNKLPQTYISKYINNITKEDYEYFCNQIINMNKYTLNEIIRTKNQSIIDSCNIIRFWIENYKDFTDIQELCDENIIIYPYDKIQKVNTNWYKEFESKIKTEKDTIIITWTNEETNMYNNHFRKYLFGNNNANLDTFVVGDILILNEFYNINCNKFNTSEKIYIISVETIYHNIEKLNDKINKTIRILKNHKVIETKFKNFIKIINDKNYQFKCYKLKVKKIDDDKNTYDIMVLIESERESHRNLNIEISDNIRKFRNILLETMKVDSLDTNLIQPLWKDFHKKFMDPFATVSYGYAITCHKAQGSNYKNVFVDFSDIIKNKNETEMKRCVYTAMSRTIDTLHILI